MRKNEPTASLRRQDIIVKKDGGDPADRSDAVKLAAMLFVGGTASPHLVAAVGTLTNKRYPVTFAPFTYTADAATDQLHAVAHGMETGDGTSTTSNAGGGLPGGLVAATPYYVVKIDVDNFKVATSLANAYASPPVVVDITTAGTGVQTWTPQSPGFQRGIPGAFTYEHTQAETNVAVDTLELIAEGTGYSAANGGGGYTSALIDQNATLLATVITADGKTVEDVLRIAYRTDGAGKILKTGNDYVVRNETDTKNSHHGTVTEAGGRTVAVIDDATL